MSCFCWSSLVSTRADSNMVVRLCCNLMSATDRFKTLNSRCLATARHVEQYRIKLEGDQKYLLVLRIRGRLSTLH